MSSLNITGTVAGTIDGNGMGINGTYGPGYGTGMGPGYGDGDYSNIKFEALQNQLNSLANDIATNVTNEKIDELAEAISGNKFDLAEALCENKSDLTVIMSADKADVAAQLNQIQSGLTAAQYAMQSGLTAAQNQSTLQTLNSFNILTTSLIQSFNEVNRDAANFAAASTLAQTVTALEQAKSCCELKARVSAEACHTRETVKEKADDIEELINSLRVQDLQTQLIDAKTANSNLVQTNQIAEMIRHIHCGDGGRRDRD
jgi:hypothetical protein